MVLRFLRDYGENMEFVPLTEADEAEILEFSTNWFDQKESDDPLKRLDSEELGVMEGIRWAKAVGITAAGVRIDGKLQALTYGSLDRSTDMVVLHVEKANPAIRGLYNFLGREFLRAYYPDVRYVNREDDMGLENLRRTKESLHPIMMGKKYTILEK